MTEKRTHCDKCLSLIQDGQCLCGVWVDNYKDVTIMSLLEKCIYFYDHHCEQHNDTTPMSGDHFTGNCYIFFKGDYEYCMKVKQFILDNPQYD
jgi:hypothetical protein